jgi:hypothetical protein
LISEEDSEDKFRRYGREWRIERSDVAGKVDQKHVDALIQDRDVLKRVVSELLSARQVVSLSEN